MLHVLLVVLAFHFWWPLGLGALAFILLRRRAWRRMAYAGGQQMFAWNRGESRFDRKIARAQEKVGRVVARAERYYGRSGWVGGASSGNHAFDEYREQTLKRLEEEQHEFHDFLGRLRAAKDRAEFDAFMTERRRAAEPPAPEAPPAPPQA